jgi:hypothetical protein
VKRGRKCQKEVPRVNALEYADARKELKTISRRKEKAYEENIIQELQHKYSRNEGNFMTGRITLRGGFQPRITVCWDETGNLIAGE